MTEDRALAPPNCNFCNKPLHYRFIDMMVTSDDFQETVEKHPHIIPTFICEHCFLVQVDNHSCTDSGKPDFSTTYSPIWLNTIQEFPHNTFKRVEPTTKGFVVELVDHNRRAEKNQVLFLATLTRKNVYSIIEMYGKPDRIICHNEMAYANNINDFVVALKLLLSPDGIIMMEFPHLLELMESEKNARVGAGVFTYFSLTTIDIILRNHQLVIFDVEDCLPKGCIRISAKHQHNVSKSISRNIPSLRGRERDSGMSSLAHYLNFKDKMERQVKSYGSV